VINKQFDLRVTVVGRNAFAAEIHSQDSEETAVDWRKGTRPDLVHKEHQPADDVAAKCIEITRSFGLRFSAIDLVLDHEGRYWFLELNPNGQWAWIERRVGLPISSAIAEELIGISKC
jgi:glutathione synthase/RimK-type ligase-like ATP-grasp enzyme